MTTTALVVSDCLSPLREKLVIFYHGDILVDSPLQKLAYFFFRGVEDRLFRKADRLIAHSPNLIRHSAVLGRHSGKVDIVPSTVPEDWAVVTAEDEREASRIRKDAGRPIVLFVGRLVPYKGLDTLVASAKMVRDAVFLLVGDGPLEGELKRRAAELGVADRFVFTGRVARLKPYYLACDVFVLPSDSPVEAFGLVQVEAMSFGKPVVTSDLPTGVTYVNQDGKTGFTFPVRNSPKLAEALNRLLSDESLRNRLGQYAKERVEREFVSAVVGRRFAEVIESVCKGGQIP
jgi:rhamnosyl/mannosyltransferase